MRTIEAALGSLRRPFIIGLGAAMWVLIASLDEAAGWAAPFSLFYVVPIALVTWYVSAQWGFLFSVCGGVVTFALAYRMIPLQASIASVVWLMFARIGSFAVVGWLIYGLKRSHEVQRGLANTDHLTGIGNIRAFRAAATAEIARSARSGDPLTVMFLDCDQFKVVNDRFGHAGGDALLRAVAETLTASIRLTDVVCRAGGDEFAILLPGLTGKDARIVVEKLRQALLERMRKSNWPVTFSIGAAVFERLPVSAEELLARSDAMQYRAKMGGKDRIELEVVSDRRPTLRSLAA